MELKRRDSIEQSAIWMQQAIATLTEWELPCDPNNFNIAYEISKGSNNALVMAVNKHIKLGRKIDNYCLEQWSDDFLSVHKPQQNHLFSELDKVLLELQGHVTEAGGSVEDYLSQLDQSITLLDSPSEDVSKNRVLENVVSATHDVKDHHNKLKYQLNASQAETEHLKQELDKLQREAVTDPLTGLSNRRGLDQYLAGLENETVNLSLLVLDIDYFKRFNDTFGHLIGDVVLAKVAEQVNKHRPSGATAVRYGGEEFILLLPDCAIETTEKLAESIREKVEAMRLINGKTKQRLPKITVSLGVAKQSVGESFEQLMLRADRAMYQAKESGRNRVSVAA